MQARHSEAIPKASNSGKSGFLLNATGSSLGVPIGKSTSAWRVFSGSATN
jgi:hypothetical protein